MPMLHNSSLGCMRRLLAGILLLFPLFVIGQITVGSKNFPESNMLAEIISQTIEQNTNLTVNRKFGLGGTLICAQALESRHLDIYPEYTGTALVTILKKPYLFNSAEEVFETVRAGLANRKIIAGPNFGFSNMYVLAARTELELEKISDLRQRSDIRYGFSNEFISRKDGISGLSKHYGFHAEELKGMDHGLAYAALANDQIDITDAYSTDGNLSKYAFTLLEDDLHFFPPYFAFPSINEEMAIEFPEVMEALSLLDGAIGVDQIRALNYRYEVAREPLEEIVFSFLNENGLTTKAKSTTRTHPIVTQTIQHIKLTLIATFLAILLAIPLGILIVDSPRIARIVMATTGAIQTIPSLALLGFMIPIFGIGFLPAIIALFLYALLPILRNTYTGLLETDPLLLEAGQAMGMTKRQLLLQVRLPLASQIIMAGVRTALTINIGTATLAAFIGAGGLGESIITGISLNDNSLILQGAIPAALLALIADRFMLWVQHKTTPKGIQKIN